MSEYLTLNDFMNALEEIRSCDVPDIKRTYYVSGISDQAAIDYFKGSGIRIVTTDGRVIVA